MAIPSPLTPSVLIVRSGGSNSSSSPPPHTTRGTAVVGSTPGGGGESGERVFNPLLCCWEGVARDQRGTRLRHSQPISGKAGNEKRRTRRLFVPLIKKKVLKDSFLISY